MRASVAAVALPLLAALLAIACADPRAGALVEVHLTAEVVEWEVVDGEVVQVWGYNGRYPGPLIEATAGDTLRVHLANNLPEATSLHLRGLGTPAGAGAGAAVEPGETRTYEFRLDRPATGTYHSLVEAPRQLARGLVGAFVVHGRRPAPNVDASHTLVLHEVGGLYTLNGRAYPATLEDPATTLEVRRGDRVRLRFVNAGQQHHPMHLDGHRLRVVALDGVAVPRPYTVATVDVAPGQAVEVEFVADNPGTWRLFCQVAPHLANRGRYPGGMITLVEYASPPDAE